MSTFESSDLTYEEISRLRKIRRDSVLDYPDRGINGIIQANLRARGIYPQEDLVHHIKGSHDAKLRTRGEITFEGDKVIGLWEKLDEHSGVEANYYTVIDGAYVAHPSQAPLLRIVSEEDRNKLSFVAMHFGTLWLPHMISANYINGELSHVAYLDLAGIAAKPPQNTDIDIITSFVMPQYPSYPLMSLDKLKDYVMNRRKYHLFYRSEHDWIESLWYQESQGGLHPYFEYVPAEEMQKKRQAVANPSIIRSNQAALYRSVDELKLHYYFPAGLGVQYLNEASFPSRINIDSMYDSKGNKAPWLSTEQLFGELDINLRSHNLSYSGRLGK